MKSGRVYGPGVLRARGSFNPFMGASAGVVARRGEARRGQVRREKGAKATPSSSSLTPVSEKRGVSAGRMRVVLKRRVLAAQRGS